MITTLERQVKSVSKSFEEQPSARSRVKRSVPVRLWKLSTYEKILNYAVPTGYQKIISALLLTKNSDKYVLYKAIIEKHFKIYSKQVEVYERIHHSKPPIKDFEKLYYLYKRDTQILITIFDCFMKDTEIPYETYRELSFIDKIKSFKFLKDDWDSYGAIKISTSIIKRTIKFIMDSVEFDNYLVFVAPLNTGGVHVAYEQKEIRIEFNFDSSISTRVRVKKGGKIASTKTYIDNTYLKALPAIFE